MELINKAFEKENKERAWQMWLVKYRDMNKENFKPFSQFYYELKEPMETKSKEEIIREAKVIKDKIEGR